MVTRDRASAYAKVIAEGLPATIKIPHAKGPRESNESSKKIAHDVDNSLIYSEKRYKTICQIQKLLKEGCSYRETPRRMGGGRNTIARYRTGDPRKLSMYGIHQSKPDIFHDFIIQCLNSEWSKRKTVKDVYEKGYDGSKSNAFVYLTKIEERECKTFEPQPYIRTRTEALKYKAGSTGKQEHYITREGFSNICG